MRKEKSLPAEKVYVAERQFSKDRLGLTGLPISLFLLFKNIRMSARKTRGQIAGDGQCHGNSLLVNIAVSAGSAISV